MERTLILYETKYGFTQKVAKSLSLILGPAKCCSTSELNANVDIFNTIVICTPIYKEGVDSKIVEFVTTNANWLTQKKVVLICTCLEENMEEQYLKPLKNVLGQSVVLQSFVSNDCKLINNNKFAELALKIKEIKDVGNNSIEEQKLQFYVDDFIKNHNTCALASAHGDSVRATPVEYVYMDKCMYIISEGGEKFLNILLNPNVSVAIYESYKNMNELAGMQIIGDAEIIDIGSDEYISVLTQRNLKYETISALPVALNLIKINIKKIEFLWSEFAKLGYDAKQILNKQ